jgi:hypothetical protein
VCAMVIRRRWAAVLATAAGAAVFMSMPAAISATPSARLTEGLVRSRVGGAAPNGTVSGVVRADGPSGRPLSGICVNATINNVPIKGTQTGRGGRYKLTGLASKTYAIVFDATDCGDRRGYLPLTRKVRVRKGHPVTGFDAFLKMGASISGKVTGTHGSPVAGICATMVTARDDAPFVGVATKSNGAYTVNALPAGTYAVLFYAGQCGNAGSYAPQYYKGQANQGAAARLKLAVGQAVTGINAVLQPGATIAGTVTGPSGHAVNNICVDLDPVADTQTIPNTYHGYQAYTANGKYTMANLEPGLYLVQFGCYSGVPPQGIAGQWALGQPASAVADYVSAAGGAVATVNAVLRRAGSVTGKVTDPAGHAIAGACVVAIPHGRPYPLLAGPYPVLHPDPNDPSANQFIGGPYPSLTGANGRYSIGGLPPGLYDVQFSDCGRLTHGGQWYRRMPTQQSAAPVRVRPGGEATGINAVLAAGGSISGRVTDGAGHGVSGLCVTARDAAGQFFGSAVTSDRGRYTITGLRSGSYQVTTFIPSCPQEQIVAGAGRGSPVTVTAPRAVTGVNLTIPGTGSITGTVSNAAGQPLDGVCALAVPTGSGGPGLALTGYSTDTGTLADLPGGRYEIDGLAPGTYQVYFDDPACLEQELAQDDDYAPSAPVQVTVTAGGLTNGIDARLERRGGITGVVTDTAHSPVAGECVTAVPTVQAADPYFGTGSAGHDVLAVTQRDGRYSLINLPPGRYLVEFSAAGCGATGLAAQWWQDAPNRAAATAVNVAVNAAVTGIDATLTR